MFKERNSSYPSLTTQLQDWPSGQSFEIHVQAFTVQTVLTVKEENLYSKTKKFLPWLGATLWTKYLIDLFLKPHPWISQLSPNYNSAGSTASKAYLIRLCQLRFQCFFFLRLLFLNDFFSQSTPPIAEIICVKNVRAKVFFGIISFKVQLFWEGHKNLCHPSYGSDIYLVNVKTIRRMAQIFVAFSENLNFKFLSDQ